MVNKCSVSGCKSLYMKDNSNVKLHRFPLTNVETLPLWIAATGRAKNWKPCKSSRLCGNHFLKSEYIVGHGKGLLKTTAIPTIEYRMTIPTLRKLKNAYNTTSQDKQNKVQTMKSDANVEVKQLDCNDIYDHQNKDKTKNLDDNHETPHYTNKDNECGSNQIKTEKKDYENMCENICNRQNQCYMFTSSFIEDLKPIVLTPQNKQSDGPSSNMLNIDQSVADLSFNKIMALKLKKKKTRTTDIYSLYFKSLKKINKQEKHLKFFQNDTASFSAFIEAQLKELCPYRKLYLATKNEIQKILMKAQLKTTS